MSDDSPRLVSYRALGAFTRPQLMDRLWMPATGTGFISAGVIRTRYRWSRG